MNKKLKSLGHEPARDAVAGLMGKDSGMPGDNELPPEFPGLTVAAVAKRLGVAPSTLRTWDRRYGLGPSEHQAGAHRRYTTTDVARLEVMRRLVHLGIAPSDAASQALINPDLASVGTAAAVLEVAEGEEWPPEGIAGTRGLTRAASSLNTAACIQIMRASIERRGIIWTWDSIISPALIGAGKRWHSTGRGIDAEHVLSHAVASCLAQATAQVTTAVNVRPILLATVEEEQHSLPLLAIAAALSERQISATVLGGRVPSDVLLDAVRRVGPCLVFLWAQMPALGGQTVFAELTRYRPAPKVLVGGPGWSGELPEGVIHVLDLSEAVSRITKNAAE